ncbi:MAG: diacylglycerol kinase family lipid kinase [Planctomycetota bacterium]|nr:diacylglycerol kinase family lipid kinase [Planctomycetota bacterium]
MSAKQVLVIANPVAGRGRGSRAARELAEHLRAAGVETEVFETGKRGDARARSAGTGADVQSIVAVGGDGTLSEVLSGLPRRTIPVGQLALGTANVLALDLGLPRDPRELARVVAQGRTRRIDVAHVGNRLCFLGASAGYDATVVHGLERLRRGPITRITWARAALSAFANYTPPEITLEVDGKLVAGAFGMVILANVVHYAGWPTLAADQVHDDGRFEAYLFPARSRLGLLRHAARGLCARFPGGGVVRVSGRRFRVAAAKPVPLQVDGDAAGQLPFELVVEPEPCRILVP